MTSKYSTMKYSLLLAVLLLGGCRSSEPEEPEDRFAQIQDLQARAIIREAIAYAGGMDRWEAIRRLQYSKDFSLLLESGEEERRYEQVHDYRYDPLKLEIVSIENGDTIRTILDNDRYTRTVNDTLVEASQESLQQAVNTSTYVVGLPFKLLDPGSRLEYRGEQTLADGRVVDVIQVNYDADAQDNHSTSDIWRYYFDRPDRKIVANWVKTSDHFSLVENLTYERVGGILFNKARKSYRIDSLGNKLYLRADYLYGDYRVE